jgi:hypothetical protein
MNRAIPSVVALMVGLPGCFLFGPTGPDPCASDRFRCEEGSFQENATCDDDDDLIVHVGAGERQYEPLEEDEQPPIVYGVQGGQHTMLGVLVENAELDRYDRLQVEIGIYPASRCPEMGRPCEGEPTLGHRSVVLGDFEPLRVTEDDLVQEYGILVFLSSSAEDEAVIQLEVRDPCGRTGIDHHRMPTAGIG